MISTSHDKGRKRVLGIGIIVGMLLAATIVATIEPHQHSPNPNERQGNDTIAAHGTIYKYGLPIEMFAVKHDTIRPRQTLAEVLTGYGLSAGKVFAFPPLGNT